MQVVPEWLELISLAFCTGVIICRLWFLTPSAEREFSYQAHFVPRMWRLFFLGVIVLTGGSIVEFLVRASEISGQPFPDFFPFVPTVLFRTHYGHVWIIRILALGLLALSDTVVRYRDTRPMLLFMLFLALIVSMTSSASGHASDSGDFSIPEIMDWLHLLAASFWGGGLMVLSVSVLPNLIGLDGDLLVAHVAGRFSKMAGIAVGIIAISALYNLWYYVRFLEALWRTSYGLAVMTKMVLFLALICLGAFNRYVSVPLLEGQAGLSAGGRSIIRRIADIFFARFRRNLSGTEIRARFKRRVGIETILILGVLFCAALIRHEIPARHMSHMGHVIEDGTFHKMDNHH